LIARVKFNDFFSRHAKNAKLLPFITEYNGGKDNFKLEHHLAIRLTRFCPVTCLSYGNV
jgi:hypothetical protein